MAGKRIGILALQGCVEAHEKHLRILGADVVLVKLPQDLERISGLILPGGESTTMIKLAKVFGLWDALRETAKEIPFWGVCAGSILMAREVQNPTQESLGVLDISVVRNAYGSQKDSFIGVLQEVTEELIPSGVEAIFIRAPKFIRAGENVKVLGKVRGEQVILREEHHLVTAFHPELGDSHWCHQYFMKLCESSCKP